jgi:hypothetical protein
MTFALMIPFVFGTLLGLDGPPKWKMHKMPHQEL